MPAALISRDEMLDRLTRVFRDVGYEGATLARLSKATGLVKASLYHYFPRGKEEMATAVLERANLWLEQRVLNPLTGSGTPAQRVHAMVLGLDAFYAGGRDACLLDLLSHGEAHDLFRTHIRDAFRRWSDAIANVVEQAGLPAHVAQRRGENAVIQIQGALVVARGIGRIEPFSRILSELPLHLFAPAPFSHSDERRK